MIRALPVLDKKPLDLLDKKLSHLKNFSNLHLDSVVISKHCHFCLQSILGDWHRVELFFIVTANIVVRIHKLLYLLST